MSKSFWQRRRERNASDGACAGGESEQTRRPAREAQGEADGECGRTRVPAPGAPASTQACAFPTGVAWHVTGSCFLPHVSVCFSPIYLENTAKASCPELGRTVLISIPGDTSQRA